MAFVFTPFALRIVWHQLVFTAFVHSGLQDLKQLLTRMAGVPDNTEMEVYEEVKAEPTVMVEKKDLK